MSEKSQTTPSSGYRVVGVNLTRNVPYDCPSALRNQPHEQQSTPSVCKPIPYVHSSPSGLVDQRMD